MNAPPPIRLLLVDDHQLVRDGLRARLEAVPGLLVAAEADSAEAALRAAADVRPDLVLMDIGMRGGNGIDATRALLAAQPALKVLMLSMFDNPEYVRAAAHAGARGYVLKDSPAEEIVLAIEVLCAGGSHFQGPLADALNPDDAGAAERAAAKLTPREREVLGLIAQGLSSKDIGDRLGMGVRTVETHRSALRRKLGLASPAALVRFAVERRWVTM
jgi:DNA-binding NarL/FixJ family response regulator